MSNFSQDQGNQGIARPAYSRREQANSQIDADIAEKGYLWMETNCQISVFRGDLHSAIYLQVSAMDRFAIHH